MMWFTLLAIMAVFILIQLVLLAVQLAAGADKPYRHLTEDELPYVAILIAARNEAHNIIACLETLVTQDYPEGKLKILVGDDHSTDDTARLVSDFSLKHPQVQLIYITENMGKARGKANVLAQLAKVARTPFFLVTDADIRVKAGWVRTMMGFFRTGTGIVSGTTIVSGRGIFASMQQTDWMYFMGMLLGFNRLGIKSTAVGNNMAITREAYESTGGYEHIDFSITEDYQLFKEVRKRGWKTVNMINRETINTSEPATDLKTLLNQRKRWLKGALGLPAYWWLIFFIFASFWPALMIMFFYCPFLATGIWLTKFLVQSFTIIMQQRQAGLSQHPVRLLYYEFYTFGLTLLSMIYFLLPVKLNWKNRYY